MTIDTHQEMPRQPDAPALHAQPTGDELVDE